MVTFGLIIVMHRNFNKTASVIKRTSRLNCHNGYELDNLTMFLRSYLGTTYVQKVITCGLST